MARIDDSNRIVRDDPATARTDQPAAGSGWAGAVPDLGARTVVGVFDDHAALSEA